MECIFKCSDHKVGDLCFYADNATLLIKKTKTTLTWWEFKHNYIWEERRHGAHFSQPGYLIIRNGEVANSKEDGTKMTCEEWFEC